MSQHLRQTIRQTIVDRMKGIPGVPEDPFEAPSEIVSEVELPAVVVWISAEPSQYLGGESSMGRVQTRTPVFQLIALARTVAELEGLALEVERRMASEPHEFEFLYRGTDFAESNEGQVHFVSAQLSYELSYETGERDPTRTIDL